MTKATARKGDGFSIIKIFHQLFSLRSLFPIKTALTARRPLFETLTVSSFRAPNSHALIGIPHPVKPPAFRTTASHDISGKGYCYCPAEILSQNSITVRIT